MRWFSEGRRLQILGHFTTNENRRVLGYAVYDLRENVRNPPLSQQYTASKEKTQLSLCNA